MNLLIAHGGGPTAVINSTLLGAVEAAKDVGDRLYAALYGVEGLVKDRIIDLTAMPYENLLRLPFTPASALGASRHCVSDDELPYIVECLSDYRIDGFMYNGGNDSMHTCHSIYKMVSAERLDISVIGIPKTMDNDIVLTDHCPGYGSAARYAAISSLELAMEAASLPFRVVIAEFMGRSTGWVASAGVFAQRAGICPVLIYLPEEGDFDSDAILSEIEREFSKGKGLLIIVSEGVSFNGEFITEKRISDEFGHSMHGGIGQYLADTIISVLGINARSERPGLLGRCSILHSSDIDRKEAYEIGRFSVESLHHDKTGKMISISAERDGSYKQSYFFVPLEEVADKERFFPDSWVCNGKISDEYIRYASPLIGDGLPEYSFFF